MQARPKPDANAPITSDTVICARMLNCMTSLVAAMLLSASVHAQCEVAALANPDPTLPNGFGIPFIDGDRAVVGDLNADERHGILFVYEYAEREWTLRDQIRDPEPAIDNSFGGQVILEGDVIVTGQPADDQKGADVGSAYVFRRDATGWQHEQTLFPSDAEPFTQFGRFLSLQGDRLFVSGHGDEPDGLRRAGAAYYFEFDGASWVEVQKINAPRPERDAAFGLLIDMHGDVAAISATGTDNYRGSVFIYNYRGDQWKFESELRSLDRNQNQLGSALSLTSNRVVAGAPNDTNEVGTQAGAAYVFARHGSGWAQEAKILATDGHQIMLFGWSVAMNEAESTAVIGARYDNLAGHEAGAARVFRRDGAIWKQASRFVGSRVGPGDNFSAALSMDEDRVIIAAVGQSFVLGEVYIFFGLDPIDCNNNGTPDACDLFEGAEDRDRDGIPDECEQRGDVDADGDTDVADLVALLAAWGPCTPPCPPACAADFTGDCEVDVADLLVLLLSWT